MPILILILMVGGILFYLRRKRGIEEATFDIKKVEHSILKKDGLLNEKITALTSDTNLLIEEFKTLENIVKENVDDQTNQATQEEYSAHNRYKDIGIKILQLKS